MAAIEVEQRAESQHARQVAGGSAEWLFHFTQAFPVEFMS